MSGVIPAEFEAERSGPPWLEAAMAAERGRFILWLPVGLLAGVLLYFALHSEPPWFAGVTVAAPAFAAALLAQRRPVLRAALGMLLAAAIGFISAQLAASRALAPELLPKTATVVTGVVRGVELLPAGRRISIEQVRLEESDLALTRWVRIRLRNNDDVPLAAGDRVRVRALVRAPSPPAYPGGWDQQREAFFSGLAGSGFAIGRAERLEAAVPGHFAGWVSRLRGAVSEKIAAVLPGATGAIAATLLTGQTAAIPQPDRAAFRDSGLAHLLAVAGLHIGIVMGLAMGVLRFGLARSEYATLHWPTKQIAALGALAAGGLYMIFTGMHVPIMRSFAMASLYTFGVLAGRRGLSIRALALAATALLLINPQDAVGVSFQMSFSAVLALIAGYEALRPGLRALRGKGGRWRRFLHHVAALALTSLLAGTASAPFGAYHFGHIQLYYVQSNMLAVPLTALWVMPWGMASLALMPLGLERLALIPMGWGVNGIIWIAHATAAMPAATLNVPHMPAWGLGLVGFGMAWVGLWRSRLRLVGLPVLVLGLVSPAFVRPPDILVSADARLIGLRTPAGMFIRQVQKGDKFVLESWEQYWAEASFAPLEAATDAVQCVADSCLIRPRLEDAAALLVRGSRRPPWCRDAAVMLSSEPARGLCPKPWPLLVDRFTVWRQGSQAIWLEKDGVRIVSDQEERGRRPWVPVAMPRRVLPGADSDPYVNPPPAAEPG